MIWIPITVVLLIILLIGGFRWVLRPIVPCSVCGHELLLIEHNVYYCDECWCDRKPRAKDGAA